MSRINSYPPIYQIGHRAATELFSGEVVVEEKIDGSQFSMCRINGELHCRSKGQQIVVDAPEELFAKAVEVARLLELQDGFVYRCEYLQTPKHNTASYSRVPTNHLALFDVVIGPENYLSPYSKKCEGERIGLEVAPVIVSGPMSPEKLPALLERESFLGGCKIEGVVVKNYDHFGPDKKILIGKFVSAAFKESHRSEWRKSNPTKTDVVQSLIQQLKTEARWRKAIQHLREKGEISDSPKDIGPLMREIQSDVEREESDYVREQLFGHFWPEVRRALTNGFPEFYKAELWKTQSNCGE